MSESDVNGQKMVTTAHSGDTITAGMNSLVTSGRLVAHEYQRWCLHVDTHHGARITWRLCGRYHPLPMASQRGARIDRDGTTHSHIGGAYMLVQVFDSDGYPLVVHTVLSVTGDCVGDDGDIVRGHQPGREMLDSALRDWAVSTFVPLSPGGPLVDATPPREPLGYYTSGGRY